MNGALPDSGCTPGNIKPTLTKDVICASDFHTSAYHDRQSTPAQKATTHEHSASIRHTGSNQICELDHLVSLELG